MNDAQETTNGRPRSRTVCRPPMKGGWEYDAFTSWRRVIVWSRGKLAYIKASYNRRARRHAREAIRRDDPEML